MTKPESRHSRERIYYFFMPHDSVIGHYAFVI